MSVMRDTLSTGEPDGYGTRTTSPDGAHFWLVNADEVKMSHWIMGGSLWRRGPAAKLFEAPYGWSFDVRTWLSNDVLRLQGRCYPGRLPGITLTIDLPAARGTIEAEDLVAEQARGSYAGVKLSEVPSPPRDPQPFEDIVRWLEAFPRT
jgi:hypothetical protein